MSHRFAPLVLGFFLVLATAGGAQSPGNPPDSRSGQISVLGVSLGMGPGEVQAALEANAGVKQGGQSLPVEVTRREGEMAYAEVSAFVSSVRSTSKGGAVDPAADPMAYAMGYGSSETVDVRFLGPPHENAAVWINRTSAMYPHPKRDRVRAALLKRYGAPTLDEERTLAWFWDEGGKLDAAGAGKTLNRHPCVLQQGNPPASCRRQLIISLTAGESKDSVRQMTISYGDAYGEREGKRQSSKFDADAHKAQQEEAGASAELPDL